MIYNKYSPINSGSVAVPANFCGLQWFGYPRRTGASVYTNLQSGVKSRLNYNNDWYNWGGSPTFWSLVETSQGVYSWNDLDTWVAGQVAAGCDIVYSCMYCPPFYSSNSAQTGTLSPAGVPAGYGGPLTTTGLTGLQNYIAAVIARYKTKGTPIKYWQIWEEPSWPVTLGQGYWWGSQQQLVDVAAVTYAAVKAADPTVIVLSPSCSNGPSAWIGYQGTISTAAPIITNTTYGYQTYDWFGADQFGIWPTNFPIGFDPSQPIYKTDLNNAAYPSAVDIGTLVASYNTQMSASGGIKPILVTSWGFSANGANTVATYWRNNTTALYRKQAMARSLLQFAALGVKGVIVYGGDANTYLNGGAGGTQIWSGDFINDTNGVIAGFNEISTQVAGKTINFCGVAADGQMIATFSDGTSYTI